MLAPCSLFVACALHHAHLVGVLCAFWVLGCYGRSTRAFVSSAGLRAPVALYRKRGPVGVCVGGTCATVALRATSVPAQWLCFLVLRLAPAITVALTRPLRSRGPCRRPVARLSAHNIENRKYIDSVTFGCRSYSTTSEICLCIACR